MSSDSLLFIELDAQIPPLGGEPIINGYRAVVDGTLIVTRDEALEWLDDKAFAELERAAKDQAREDFRLTRRDQLM